MSSIDFIAEFRGQPLVFIIKCLEGNEYARAGNYRQP